MSKSKNKDAKKKKGQPESNPAPADTSPSVPTAATGKSNAVNWAKVASFVVLLIVIGVIGIFSLRVMQSFLLPLFLAALVVVIFRPIHTWILDKTNGRKRLAALFTTSIVLLAVLGPLAWGIKTAIQEGAVLSTGDWDLGTRLEKLRTQFRLQMPHKTAFEDLERQIAAVTPLRGDDGQSEWQISPQKIEVLGEISDGLINLQDAVDSDESKPQSDLLPILESIAEARDAANRLLQEDERSVGANKEYEKAVTRLEVQLDKIRDDVSGGFPRGPLVQLVNPSDEELESWQTTARDKLQHWLLSISGRSTAVLGSVLFGLSIMVISIYYFLIDGPEMIKTAMRLSPLDDQYEEELLVEFGKVSRAVVLATLLSAVVQGLLAGIGYFFAGLEPVFLLTVLTMMLAMVPFVGAAAIWVPAALYLAFIENQTTAGIGLAIYGFVIVSMADNVIKPFILHGQSNLHPLMALLSVLGGVQALGPIGILVGPMLLAFLQALLNMLRKEITTLSA